MYIEHKMNAAAPALLPSQAFALTGVPGCVDGFMPLVDADASAAESVAAAYASMGKPVRIVAVERGLAAQWLRDRAGEHSSSSKPAAVRKRAELLEMAASI